MNLYEWISIAGKITQYQNKEQLSVSIIVAARNEEKNIQNLLNSLEKQDYPNLEIIVINDRSTDNTLSILQNCNFNKLRIIDVEQNDPKKSSKKQALTKGINEATNEVLLFTDADCEPGPNWVKHMVSQLGKDIEIVVGLSPYKNQRGILNQFIQFETSWTAQQMLGWGMKGIPYMGLGRNIMYKKSLFHRIQGHTSHDHILSGDDDLFMQRAANKNNVAFSTHPESHILTIPEISVNKYIKQKMRHLSTGSHYRLKHLILLGTHSLFGILFYTSLVSAFFFSWKIALLFLFIRLIFKQANFQSASRKFSIERPSKTAFLFDLCYFLYLSALGIISPANKSQRWR